MPGPFRLRPRADEMQPLGIVRQIDCDRELEKLRLQQPRTETVRRAWDYWLDRRLRLRAGDASGVTRPKPTRCDCDYFEGVWAEDENGPGIDEGACECGHTSDQHENRADACTQPADPQPTATAPYSPEAKR